jgi:hypothetical protein
MSARRVILTTTAVYAVLGSALAIFGPLMLRLYGFPSQPSAEMPFGAWWNAASFARLFGITLAGLAVIVWSLRACDPRSQHKLIASLAVANVFIAAFSYGQWRTVWGTNFGILTVFLFGALAILSLIRVAESQRDLG